MKPLDRISNSMLSDENARRLLSDSQYKLFCAMSEDERETNLRELLSAPIGKFTVINELYFRSKWSELFEKFYGNNRFVLLEVASGDADMIPQTMSRTNPASDYLTANMNVKLNQSLLKKTDGLDIKLRLIDDDAANIKQYVSEKSVDMIAFQHGANDVIQAILCGQNGVDTTYSDWMKTLPKMIEILQTETKNGTLEEHVKIPFLGLISNLLDLLKSDGVIAIHHYMFKLDLDWGYPPELFENIIPLVRKWCAELDNSAEIMLDGFDSQWWLFLKRKCKEKIAQTT